MKSLFIALLVLVSAKSAYAFELNDVASPNEIASELPYNPIQNESVSDSDVRRLQIVVNKAQKGTAENAQTLEAYLDGNLLYRTTVSTGKETIVTTQSGHQYRATTPVGTFHITHRDIDHKSVKWGGAPMPFAQFFVGGVAIHATVPEHFANLGQRDSGGCVRLYPSDAKLMWKLVDQIGSQNVEIIVYDGSVSPHPLGRSASEVPRYPTHFRPGVTASAPGK